MTHSPSLPAMARPDAGTTLISEWIVSTPERQRKAAGVLLAEWRELSARFRPEAFLQLSCFASHDGRVLLSLAQWADDAAHLAFARAHRSDMVGRIDQAIPGIERPGLMRYRLFRSVLPDSAPDPGDVIAVVRADTASAEAARRWADSTADRLRKDPPAGLSAAHLLVSTDGRHALLCAPISPHVEARELTARTAAEGGEGVDVHPPQCHRLLGSVRGPRGGAL